MERQPGIGKRLKNFVSSHLGIAGDRSAGIELAVLTEDLRQIDLREAEQLLVEHAEDPGGIPEEVFAAVEHDEAAARDLAIGR